VAMARTTSRLTTGLRRTFAVALFIAWGIQTSLLAYGAFHSLNEGDPSPAIKAAGAILLLILLAGMEGLEVAVIDRWNRLHPQRTFSALGRWLAARSLFPALIIPAVTILGTRTSIAIPGSATEITGKAALAVFNLTWTGFTVLWFTQIFPKTIAAIDPGLYLKRTHWLMPIVEVASKIGFSSPGIWIATTVGLRLDRATAGLIAQSSFSLTARLRTIFALMLFVTWGIQTNLWVNDAFYFLVEGEPTRAIRATGTILLMIVLAGLEGLEVAVINRWRDLYPQQSSSVLSNWLASRQLFTALMIPAITILSARDSIAVLCPSTEITGNVAVAVFNLTWTGFAVLWFTQIVPKFLAAIDPDLYLRRVRGLRPMVEVVRRTGATTPGVWLAAIGLRLASQAGEPALQEGPAVESVANIWAGLIVERTPLAAQRPPERRSDGSTGG
jgi:hypothetical protein